MESDSEFERRQEEEAAAEARRIGAEPGRDDDELPPGESSDPARRVVEEAGGGESEGFELAEAELIDRAENPRGPSPLADRERVSEDDRAEAEYGESDSVRTSEDDPDRPDEDG
jgi:hypothetical protein